MSKDKLTDSKLRTAKPEDKEYNLGDGDGLYLRIKPNGNKMWLFNYYRPDNKKRANLSFGPYPDVTLAAARERRRQARALLSENIDPQTYLQEQIAITKARDEASSNTFVKIARQWLDMKRHDVSEDYAEDTWRSLEMYILPDLANKTIDLIRAPMVISLLRPLEADGKLETVRRLCQRVNEIMSYAVNHGLLDANPCADIRKVFKKPSKKHMPTIRPDELPLLMADIINGRLDATTRCQIEWSLHTLVRPNESAGTRWDEIDLESKIWTIPAERMKMDRTHRIPLTKQAIALLERMKPISGHRPHVFPSYRNPLGHIHEQTANAALKRLGYGGRLVAHGLRSLGSTTLNEQEFNPDVIEAALSHADDNEIRRAYNRSDYFEQRIKMMQWWSDHIEAAAQGWFSLGGSKGLKIVKS